MTKINRRKFTKISALTGIGIGISAKTFTQYAAESVQEGKRIGIIGLDGSHAVAFTQVINNPAAHPAYKGYRVVAAYPKGSHDIQSSVSRVPGYTEDMKNLGVEIVKSLDELIDKTDAIFMVTNDGRRHLEQAIPVFKAGKRMYIDKPLAASLKDGMDIFAAASYFNVPVYSCSNARFNRINKELANGKIGKVIGADVYGPSPIEKTHPTLFWYGIHGVEALCSIMGTGCESVVRVFNNDTDISIGTWPDNRLGVNRAMRTGKRGTGGTAYGEKGIVRLEKDNDELKSEVNEAYKQMIDFFSTGIVPVRPEETLEVLAFMEAADESLKNNGKAVKIEKVMLKAQNAKGRLKL